MYLRGRLTLCLCVTRAELTAQRQDVDVIDDPWNLRDALAGDEAAWASLVEQFNDQIWHWARSCRLDFDESLDVAQTVWLRLKDRGHTIEDPARLPGWLATTTKRLAIEVKERIERAAIVDLTDHEFGSYQPLFSTPPPSPGQHAIAAESQERLTRAYGRLSAQCQELLPLLWSRTLSYEEIGELLGTPEGSIGPTRKRCLKKLRQFAGIDEER